MPDEAADEALSRELKRTVKYSSQALEELKLDRLDPTSLIEESPEMSAVEQQPIALGAPAGTFFDFAPLHIITTNTLAVLSPSACADLTDAARFRANLIVDCPDAEAFVENAWVGRTLRIGGDLAVKVVIPTPRCAIPTLEHRGLPTNLEALRILVKRNRVEVRGVGIRPCAGVYARPISSGGVEVGAPVEFVD